jgi:hypothetical protein
VRGERREAREQRREQAGGTSFVGEDVVVLWEANGFP